MYSIDIWGETNIIFFVPDAKITSNLKNLVRWYTVVGLSRLFNVYKYFNPDDVSEAPPIQVGAPIRRSPFRLNGVKYADSEGLQGTYKVRQAIGHPVPSDDPHWFCF